MVCVLCVCNVCECSMCGGWRVCPMYVGVSFGPPCPRWVLSPIFSGPLAYLLLPENPLSHSRPPCP